MFTDPSATKKPDAASAEGQSLRKFLFEHAFDGAAAAPIRDRRPVTLTPEKLDALKQEMHEAGFAAGRKAGAEEQSQKFNGILSNIGNNIGALLQQTESKRHENEARLREAVFAIARKVLPDYSKRHGLQEIEAVVAGVIGEMASEPRLVLRVNEMQFDTISGMLKAITEKEGYAGKVVLVADAQIIENDCRIEWADGGIERNLAALWNNLGKTLAPGPAQTSEETNATTLS